MPPGREPRAWQVGAVEAARAWFSAGHRSAIISAATGTGKGTVIAALAQMSAVKGRRCLIVTWRDELVADLEERVKALPGHADVGVVQQKRNEWLNPIVVASAASCTKKRLVHVGRVDLLITDEAHHSTCATARRLYAAVEESFPNWKHLGMTATPFRSAAKGKTSGLGTIFEGVVFEHGIADAIDAGDLVPLKAYNVSTDVNLGEVETWGGDFEAESLAKVIDCDARNRIVVEQYQARCERRPTLVFAATIEHAKHLAAMFLSHGVEAEAAWGDMPPKDRKRVVESFKGGRLPVVVSVDLIREGFDAPNAGAILKARPTQSRLVFVQMVGRGLRTAPEKRDCIFVDFVDNGCELDLATVADLSEAKEQQTRPWEPGDTCLRRHHEDWGVGLVLEVDLEAKVPHALVEWGPSRVRKQAERIDIPTSELVHPPADKRARPEEVVIEPRVNGVRVYPVFLLPGQTAETRGAVGFYEYQGTWSASGWMGDDRIAVHVCWGDESGRWEAWEILTPPKAKDRPMDAPGYVQVVVQKPETIQQIASETDPVHAIRKAERWLKDRKVRYGGVSAAWKDEPASEKQLAALRKWGIRRDMDGMSKGEASGLLDGRVASQKIRDYRKSQRRCA